ILFPKIGVKKWRVSWRALWLFCLSWNTIAAQIRYSIPEELKIGSVVCNIAKDLDLKLSDISDPTVLPL
uniref:Cadherin N-terminal domain-containing protein n=1 Tax=Pygocentrus nattereri TaxID=42514 RepID=A0AAR2KJ18_PYGNA